MNEIRNQQQVKLSTLQENIEIEHHTYKEPRREITKFIEVYENESKTYQNLWDTAKAALRVKLIAMSAYTKN
jgi:hypothetical protein